MDVADVCTVHSTGPALGTYVLLASTQPHSVVLREAVGMGVA